MKNKFRKKSFRLNTSFYSKSFDSMGNYTGTSAVGKSTPEQDSDDL